jgi:hypothetical protein
MSTALTAGTNIPLRQNNTAKSSTNFFFITFSNFAVRRDFGRVVASSPTAEAPRPFNGDFGSSRDASVCDDGAKPKSPGRWAQALGWTSSLRMAIQIEIQNRRYYRVRDWRRNFAQSAQSGERVLLISFS